MLIHWPDCLTCLQFPEWQRARAGLASGRAPKLAPAGSGGSYFFTDEDGNHVAGMVSDYSAEYFHDPIFISMFISMLKR